MRRRTTGRRTTRAGRTLRTSSQTCRTRIRERDYSLQAAKKTVEGKQHPDRNAQFEHINAKAEECIERGVPFISVDTKKKELVGNFKNAGREWQLQDEPELGQTTRRDVRIDLATFALDGTPQATIPNIAPNQGSVKFGVMSNGDVISASSSDSQISLRRGATCELIERLVILKSNQLECDRLDEQLPATRRRAL